MQQTDLMQHTLSDAVEEITALLNEQFERFDEQTFNKAVDKVLVHPKQRHGENATTKITFVFKCGMEMVERI